MSAADITPYKGVLTVAHIKIHNRPPSGFQPALWLMEGSNWGARTPPEVRNQLPSAAVRNAEEATDSSGFPL